MSQHFKPDFIGYGTEEVLTSAQFINIKGSQWLAATKTSDQMAGNQKESTRYFFKSHSK